MTSQPLRRDALSAWALLCLALGGAGGLLAAPNATNLRLPGVLSPNMVLQREAPVPIWGWADAGGEIEVSFAGQTKTATVGADSRWQVLLDPLPTSAEPRELVIQGAETRTIGNVLVGEVWLGAGQSNINFPLKSNTGFAELREAADLPLVRSYRSRERETDAPGSAPRSRWEVCSPGTVGEFSVVQYLMALELRQRLGPDVPIGLLTAAVGGTRILLWIDREAQVAVPELAVAVRDDEAALARYDLAAETEKYLASQRYLDWQAAAAKAEAEGCTRPNPPPSPQDILDRWKTPGTWFRVHVLPLAPFAVRGFVWYQGEADGNLRYGSTYRQALTTLIASYRGTWQRPDLPVGLVQLPYWEKSPSWSIVREAQLQVADTVPGVGLITTIDASDPKDVHPADKTLVGQRLGQWAAGALHGVPGVAVSGPRLAEVTFADGVAKVRFTHATGGLVAIGGGALSGFEVVGNDRQWRAATAQIEGDTVIVSAPGVAQPTQVRYNWGGLLTDCTLYNAAGWPASPFRTDRFPLNGDGR